MIGEGILYVKRDGSILRFCSSKCLRNSVKLGRNPRKVKWVVRKTRHGGSSP
ncbi:MAG: 50S ribosomal protein L24e [Candidatus Brockarchaeota archaeon]|nr:50S ribosomal protein L24e [Candidatus Brockarchaeota archaeon]